MTQLPTNVLSHAGTITYGTNAADRAAWIAQQCAKAACHGDHWQACCPAHEDTNPSLSITPAGDRVLIKCHAKCFPDAVMRALGRTMADLFVKASADYGWKGGLRGSNSTPRVAPPAPRQPTPEDIQQRQMAIERVWRQSVPVALFPQDPVVCYLRQRGLWQEPVPEVLRCHPNLRYYHTDGRFTVHPAMVAAVQAPQGTLVNVHRIYLANSGTKADVPEPKKLMRSPTTVAGAAVRLDTPTDTLAVTEGIETALAVRLTAGLPVWAAISAGGMTKIVIPDTVRLVIICADNDLNGTGERAAKTLAQRLMADGRRVKILMPSTPGTDGQTG